MRYPYWNHLEKANAKPLFAQKGLHVLSSRVLGKNRNVAKLQLSDHTGCVVEAVYFGEADEFVDAVKETRQYFSYLLSGDQQVSGKRNLTDRDTQLSCRINILTESSKSPASIARSDKQEKVQPLLTKLRSSYSVRASSESGLRIAT